MRPVWGFDHVVLPYLHERCGARLRADLTRCLAVVDAKGRLAGAVAFHDYSSRADSIEITAASDRRNWISKALLHEGGRYVFDTCGCRIALCRTPESNSPVRRLFAAFGAHETVIPEVRGPDEAEVVCVVRRADWESNRFMR